MEQYNGFYRGVVLRHELNGRCRIWIPGVYDDSLKEKNNISKIPLAEPARPIFGGSFAGNGNFSYPSINTIVWCFFENGDQNYPVFFAYTPGGSSAAQQFNDLIQGGGADDAYWHSFHVKNSHIKISECGMIDITTKNGEKYSNVNINQDGNIKIDSTLDVHLHTQKLVVEADEFMKIQSPNIVVDSQNLIDIKGGRVKTTAADCIDMITPDVQQKFV